MTEKQILEQAAEFIKRAEEINKNRASVAEKVRMTRVLRNEMDKAWKDLQRIVKKQSDDKYNTYNTVEEYLTDVIAHTTGQTSKANYSSFLYDVRDYVSYHLETPFKDFNIEIPD